ncbi:phosphotransferase [Nonomuraea soli]|uniref:Spectinomycin phosphotransferase n=1 Tax=Nonomuraea soli TaxID=1032476 RepID=A0A7W0CVM4_9ACTN|nr:phosphotransferase [Nonomuraea soli]MBA2897944.1 spectinomycin phosphotransferase [Nonomuraea soli]
MTADYSEVFQRFGIEPQDSIYPYSPVFRGEIEGRQVAVKRTHYAEFMGPWVRELHSKGIAVVTPLAGPHKIGDFHWVAYPWIDGRAYDGSIDDVAAAGAFLGRLHAQPGGSLPAFPWPDHDEESVQDDIDGLTKALSTYRPDLREQVLDRLAPLLRAFMSTTLPAIRDAGLPAVDATVDYKAVNLVYTEAGPVLIDPDNGEHIPRLLDLALATLLFHNDLAGEPAALFDEHQWAAFRDAYLGHVELTETERALWPTALTYMLLEWGVWSVCNDDWADPRHAAFFADLITVDTARFPL